MSQRLLGERSPVMFFHPNYPSTSPIGGVILQSSNGVCFRFPLNLLSVSEVFANAAEVSALDDTTSPVIPLDIVSSDGLNVVLSVLQPVDEHYNLEDKTARLRDMEPDTLAEGYEAADLLEIHGFAELLLPYFTDLFYRFAIASRSEDAMLLQATAEETFDLEFNSISRTAQRLLELLNPSAFDRLRRLHGRRRETPPKTLLAAMMSQQPMPDGLHDFSRTCRKSGCSAMRSVKGRSWARLRSRGASEVWAVLVKMGPLPCQWKEIANWVLEGSCKGCGTCKGRLSACFGRALDEAGKQLPREL